MSARHRLLPAFVALASMMPGAAAAYAFGVSPIRLDFSRTERAGAITVSNDESIKVSFQVRLVRWTQDASGRDRYEDSKDLVYFPRLMTLEPKEKRVIRVGTKAAPVAVEGTYRLVIEEVVPPPTAAKGPAIAVRMSFAVPVFVAPTAVEERPEVENLDIAGGELRFQLRNRGNRHVKLESIALRRDGAVVREVAGWYVLAGIRRGFSIPFPRAECGKGRATQLVLAGEGLGDRRELVVDVPACSP